MLITLPGQLLKPPEQISFTECLVNLGAVKPDGDLFVISREDLEHYIGE